METLVKKRDGRIVDFNENLICAAVNKCVKNTDPNVKINMEPVLKAVRSKITADIITVEQIQDIVESELMKQSSEIAKSYILYRNKRNVARDFTGNLTQTLKGMMTSAAKDMNLMRENANINADVSMGVMLRIGSEASKDFSLKYLIKPEYAGLYKDGDIHIHDLDFYPICFNCCQIPLGKMLRHGFNTGHGHVNQPHSIITAAALACIVLQSNQNEMFGGQSFPCWEYDLAPYVAKTFAKKFTDFICDQLEDTGDDSWIRSQLPLEKFDNIYNKHQTILSAEAKADIRKMLKGTDLYSKFHSDYFINKAFERATFYTERDVSKAMKAVIHNLNTMQSRCLPADEKILIKDGYKNINKLKVNDYVLSFNVNTQRYEYKKVKRVLDNGEKELLLLVLENGQRLRCTPDHKLYTSKGYVEAQFAKDVLTKDGFSSVVFRDEDTIEEVYDIEVEDNHNFCVKDKNSDNFAVVHNCGAQVPFSCLNYGTGTKPEERMIIKHLLLETEKGLGDGETPIFPVQIFKLKDGVNTKAGDPNFDLFELACRVSAKRLFPNFSFIDSPYNLQYYKPGHPETEVAIMGCRTRTIGNVYDPTNEVCPGRGNLFFTTINLPRLGIEAKHDVRKFFEMFDKRIDQCFAQCLDRLEIISRRHAYNYPFLMGEHVWTGSEKLKSTDEIREAIKQGSMALGFIGLAECLVALTGKHHGESEESRQLGLKIIRHLRKRCDEECTKTGLTWACFATPAEGLSGRFVKIDAKRYGIIPGVTDRKYYTNSFHVPVYYDIRMVDKIRIEAPYHEICNGGSISYIELDGDPAKNVKAFERIVLFAKENNMCYFSINHAVDRCPICGYTGVIGDECPKCGFREGEGVSEETLIERGIPIPDCCC